MRHALTISLLSFGLALTCQAQVPQMSTVQPDSAKVGSVLRVDGRNLGKDRVEKVYLTDHTLDVMVKVLDQTEDSIEFSIPPSAKPGRLQLLVKTAGKQPMLLEQPVYVTVQDYPESDDGILLQRIQQEPTPSRKQVLLEKYAAQYSEGSSIAWVYEQLLPIYRDAKEYQKVIAIGNALLAVDPNNLDAVQDVLRAAEATGATELVRVFSQRAWDIASKAVQTPKPTDPDDLAGWNKLIDFANEVLSYSEFVMATQAANEPDPVKRAALVDALRSRNPNSKFMANTNKQRATDPPPIDPEKAVVLAEQGLVNDPNNENFLLTVADYKFTHEKDFPLVLTYSLRILELMRKKPQPATLSAEEWEKKKARFTGWASYAAGVVYGKQGRYALSDRYLREAVPLIRETPRLLAAAYYYLAYDNYAMAFGELGDKSRAAEAVKYSKLCAAMDSPYRPLARETMESVRIYFNLQ
ncbi:MAG TPA: IPT/TIG domain-containing protein [Bryobacteraceae bacterium]|nr:IPT/TIG domain-containing protein [Bryobacteraceae bacterium]